MIYENPDDVPKGSEVIDIGYADGHIEGVGREQAMKQIRTGKAD